MKIQYKIFVVFALMLSFTACKKDFLEVDPIGKLAVQDFYQTDEDATRAIMASYDILQWMNARDWNSAYLVKTFPSDESNVAGGGDGDQPPYQELGVYSYGASNPTITAVWESNYFGIYRANMVINNVPGTTPLQQQIIGEAQFLRAYYYFEIAAMFGNGPLILTELAPSEYSQPFVDATVLYDQAIADLEAAIDVLPKKSEYDPRDVFRAAKGTAQALLGKVNLYAENWADAATAFEAVITSNEYELQGDYSTLFLQESEFGVESLLEASWVTTMGYDWGTFQWGGNRAMENNITWQLTGPRGDFFNAGETGLIGGWGFNLPKQGLYDAFASEGDEIRKAATILSLEDLRALGGNWTDESAWGWDNCIRVKYSTRMDETNGDGGAVPELNYGTNLRLIRYADVLLMAAEAHHKNGNDGQAGTYLNMVRTRAGLDGYTGNIMDAIKKERQMELAFEAVRFLDLVRWGDAATVLGPLGFQAGKHNLYPIPSAEMRNNTNAVQNPGY
ncbi:RagB/SusD family nutrient uptake outer membrane protein [Lentimicrobium sp. S6]|uniref:RagB/SusD family nutrient uptake outer membrane protein n=1 Tax=Lentimicrobium sp. S6 TaxID=2735872 RepID=UPI0015517050|nr:RagB/SusD family nutrient uptake outer membrane protein [Lentimicrobium sp. S6]NPD47309.1 RagB/SusD family nutrient uptake outer membrane protein [Lentimicrobium sp. S6]